LVNSKKDTKKQLQKNEIVKLLYVNKALTNANLVKETGLSLPTITQLLAELSEEKYIEIMGSASSSGGRKPNLVGLTEDAFYFISVAMERYSVKLALINSKNVNVTGTRQFVIDLNDKNATVDIVSSEINKFVKELKINNDRLKGVGISLPGLTNSDKGVNLNFLNFGDIALSEILKKRIGLPVYIINDAKSRALAELRFGKAKNTNNTLVIYIGWGLGTGLILDGKLYNGSSGFSGEFSHIPVIENGIMCRCGKRGCLETVASGNTLSRVAIEGIAKGENTDITRLTGKNPKTIHYMTIVESALKGDSFSIDILAEVGAELGRGIAMLVQILNPELILFGGQMLKAGHFLTIPIEHSLNKYCLNDLRNSYRIEISDMGESASLLGPVINAVERHFSNPNNIIN
jgi:predicted NBD/HSP70 family sugar kinase